MKLRNLILSAAFGAGSLQSAIIQGNTGLSGPTFVQDFSAPNVTLSNQQLLAPAGSTVTQFSFVTLSSNTGLFYDPNGAPGCTLGNGSNSLNNISSTCVGNYNSTANVSVNGNPNGDAFGSTPNPEPQFSILFNSPVSQTSFVLATPANGSGFMNTFLQVFAPGGTTLLESKAIHTNLNNTNDYITISGDGPIGSVVLSSTGTNENPGPGSTQTPWEAITTDIAGTTAAPEPGTLGLLGAGLLSVTLLARRRKA